MQEKSKACAERYDRNRITERVQPKTVVLHILNSFPYATRSGVFQTVFLLSCPAERIEKICSFDADERALETLRESLPRKYSFRQFAQPSLPRQFDRSALIL